FHLVADAWNIAEKYQIPVMLLTDKYVAECLFCLKAYDTSKTVIDRGNLITNPEELAALKAEDRYRITEDGISPRWIPGAHAAGYDANSDEHTPDGTVTEDSAPVKNMFAKRMRKMETLSKALPEPELFTRGESGIGNQELGQEGELDILLIGWGSTKNTVLDVMEDLGKEGKEGNERHEGKIGYLHFTYLWPLKTERFKALHAKAKRTILIEGNYQGQLGVFLREKTGIEINEKLLKYDGRPFFLEELRDLIVKGTSVPSVPSAPSVTSSS
ncbi:MAG TPA: hypothetical protein VI873_03760, partial [Candidatus Peribacteraceae bacterium]|nr:hypothetical protein [Candidatus Peribacteraceae bacterium]